jgi:hypothetical protein
MSFSKDFNYNELIIALLTRSKNSNVETFLGYEEKGETIFRIKTIHEAIDIVNSDNFEIVGCRDGIIVVREIY